MNCRCYQIILRAKHFCTNQERCEVLTGYLSLGCRPGGDVTLGKTFYKLLFKQAVAAAPVTAIFSNLVTFFDEAFIKSIIIILCINYAV